MGILLLSLLNLARSNIQHLYLLSFVQLFLQKCWITRSTVPLSAHLNTSLAVAWVINLWNVPRENGKIWGSQRGGCGSPLFQPIVFSVQPNWGGQKNPTISLKSGWNSQRREGVGAISHLEMFSFFVFESIPSDPLHCWLCTVPRNICGYFNRDFVVFSPAKPFRFSKVLWFHDPGRHQIAFNLIRTAAGRALFEKSPGLPGQQQNLSPA